MFSQTHFDRVKFIFTNLFLLFSLQLMLAQVPANDICSGAIPLSITPLNGTCPSTVYTTVGATDALGTPQSPNPGCFNGLKAFKDVWFTFTTPASGPQNFRIEIKGVNATDSIRNPQVSLYIGDCTVGLFEEYCQTQVSGINSGSLRIDAGNMRANTTYYIQVANYQSTDIGGKFTACVKPFEPVYLITQDPQTSTAAQGILYDSGGANGNYSDFENQNASIPPNVNNYTFNIRPSATGCIELTIDSLGTEPNYDTLTITDGRTGQLLDRISGTSTQALTFQVPTNWVVVKFRSDESTTSRGFKLSWRSLASCNTPKATLCSAPEVINSLPFRKQTTTCNDRLDAVDGSRCGNDEFLEGKDHVFKFTSNGGQCIKVTLTNFLVSSTVGLFGRPTGINVGIYRGCPSETAGECITTGRVTLSRDSVVIGNGRLELPGDYYIVVSRREACTPFSIQIDTVPCLNRLPNAGYCNRALSLNDCSSSVTSDIVLDMSSKGDSTFIQVDPPSDNAGCIGGLGFIPGIDTPRYNYVFMTFRAENDGKFGFTIAPITTDVNSDIDFNVYGPIANVADICNFAKRNAPLRSSFGVERTSPGRTTGMVDSYVNTLGNRVVVADTCEQGLGDGLVKRLDVKKGNYYVIWLNDYRGTIGTNGVRLNFSGTTMGVLDSLNDPLINFAAGKDTVLFPGRSTQLTAKGGVSYTWTPANGLSSATAPNPVATPTESTVYNVAIQGTCRVVPKSVKVDVFKVNDLQNISVCKGEQTVFNAGTTYPPATGATWTWTSSTNHLAELSCTNCPSPSYTATNTSGLVEVHTFTVTLSTPAGNLTETFNVTVAPGTVARYEVKTSLTPTRDTNVCIGSNFTLLKDGFDPTAVYVWSSTPASTLTGSNPSVSPTNNIKYYVTVTGGAGGCIVPSTDSVIVNVYQPPVLNGIADANICVGEKVIMGTSPVEDKTTYSWTPSVGLDKSNVPNPTLTVQANPNTYILTATNLGGCVSKDTIIINGINLQMKIDTVDSIRICKGTPLRLKVTTTPTNLPVRWRSDYDFSVTDSATSVAVNPARIARYYATITQSGCTRRDTAVVYVDSLPFNTTILPKDTVVCKGTEVIFRSAPYEPILFPNISFKWTPKRTQLTSDTLYNLVIEADTTPKRYYREMTNGVCKQTDSVDIKVNPIPVVTVIPNDTTLCSDNVKAVILLAKADNPEAKDWKWTGPDGQEIPNSKDKTIVSVTPQMSTNIYTVQAKIGDCPGSATATIRVISAPTVQFPANDVLCLGDGVVINETPNSTNTYSWASNPTGFTSTAAAPRVQPIATTTYSVTVTSPNGCRSNFSKEIKVATGSLTVSPNAQACTGDPVTLTATGTTNIGGTYRWNTGQTTATITPVVTASGNYTVTFSYGTYCSLTRSIAVTAIPGFTTRITPDTFSVVRLVDQGTAITLNTVLTGNAPSPTYSWKDNNKDVGTAASLPIKPLEASHIYLVNVTASTGCKSSAQVVVTVRFPNYEIPNAFTPNGDNTNPTFYIEFDSENKSGLFNPGNQRPRFWKGNIVVQSFQIFNRWGQKVFEEINESKLNDKSYKGWDGKKGEVDLPSDVYVYLFKLKMPDGTIKSVTGEVNLIR